MTIQQMLLGSPGLTASASPGTIMVHDPAPSYPSTLSGLVTITASGGSGSYTYSSSWLSGGIGITITNGSTSTPGAAGTSSSATERTGTIRTVVSDGSTSVNVDITVSLVWGTPL